MKNLRTFLLDVANKAMDFRHLVFQNLLNVVASIMGRGFCAKQVL